MTNTPTAPPVPEPTPQNQLPSQTPQEVIVVNEQRDARNREKIALWVLIFSIIAVFLTSVVVVLTAEKGDKMEEASQRVMASTLPLYGTWVGTILAFYFSRNAFEAASSATARNADVFQKVNRDPVLAPDNILDKISLKALANDLVFRQTDINKPLQDVVDELESRGRYRTIVIDADKKYVDLVYRINASAFLTQSEGNLVPPPPTLKTYLDWRHNQGSKAQPIVVFLPESATLADAEAKLEETTGCRDVIVTTDGSNTSQVVVYVTDADINEYKRPVAL